MAGDPAADIVPFGKYKGRPVVDLISDRSYTDWLAAQPWFREKYGTVYNLIVHTGAEPQDTPEHNALQAQFLDHDEALRIARGVLPGTVELRDKWQKRYGRHLSEEQRANLVVAESHQARIEKLQFEVRGWDVCIEAWSTLQVAEVESELCSCECDPETCRPRFSAPEHALVPNVPSDQWSDCFRPAWGDTPATRLKHCAAGCREAWRRSPHYEFAPGPFADFARLAVELKPTVGEDYPTVLRQVVKRRDVDRARGIWQRGDIPVVLTRAYVAESVSYEKAQKIFDSQGVALVLTTALAPPGGQWACSCETCS